MSTSNSIKAQETTKYSLREANVARQAEWDAGNQITLSYRGNEMAGEVGEACNVIKKLDRERMGIRGSRDTIAHLAEELADVIICADLIAASVGIDLDGAVRDKFNATSRKNGLATRLGWPPTNFESHELYQTGDADAPDVIKDRNGEVVLGLCRKCGRGEIELADLCDTPLVR